MDDARLDDVTTEDTSSVTRRAALAAGAAGVAGLTLTSQAAGSATKVSAARYNRVVIVSAPKDIVFNLDKVQAIQQDILGQLGCRACCSGFDFHFPDELQFVFPEQGVAVQHVSPEAVTAPPDGGA
jgi:hypothetical protein